MDFAHSPRVSQLQTQLRRFIDDLVLTAHAEWQRYAAAGVYPLDVIAPMKERARALGLWNLFLPDLREHEPGTQLSNLEYAPLAEMMGPVAWASEVFNCNAPDTGNIELDGLDEVHLRTIARAELARAKASAGSMSPYLQHWMPPHPGDRSV